MNRRCFFHLFALLGFTAKPIAATATAPPSSQRIVLQRSPVRGFRYRQSRDLLAQLKPGDAVTLRAEPDNPHDRRAVMVFWEGRHLGYLPREDNAHASRLLRQGFPLEGAVLEVHPEQFEWEPLRIEVAFPATKNCS